MYSIKQQYGSTRGLFRLVYHRMLDATGRYNNQHDIDWSRVNRLVFACQGNICRSAYAEYVARRCGLDAISCGVDTRGGDPANERAIAVASERGIDLLPHRTSRIQNTDLLDGDLLLAMEPRHLDMAARYEVDGMQSSLLGLWQSPARPYLHDPYNAPLEYFHHCFDIIERAIDGFAGHLR